jgi:hypothetical protein
MFDGVGSRRIAVGLSSAMVLLALMLAACGSSTPSSNAKPSGSSNHVVATKSAASSTTTSTTISALPGCSQFCAQAGPPGGMTPHLATCPAAGCLAVLSTTASIQGGSFAVSVQCLVSVPCVGTLSFSTMNEVLGQTAISVAANQTGNVSVPLSTSGQQLAGGHSSILGSVSFNVNGSSGPETPQLIVLHT